MNTSLSRKNITLPLWIAILMLSVNATGQGVVNGDFEDWSTQGEGISPVGWNTSNNLEDNDFPVSVERSELACTGEFSMKISSTGPSLEGPGSGFANQTILLDNTATGVTMEFSFAVDTLSEGTNGVVILQAFENSNPEPELVTTQEFTIDQMVSGCQTGLLTLEHNEGIDRITVKLEANPHYVGTGTEGLAIIRFDNIQLSTVLSDNLRNKPGSQVVLLPNPVANRLTIQNTTAIKQLELFDTRGNIIRSLKPGQRQYDLSDIAPGTYLLRFITTQGAFIRQVVKN